MCFLTCFRDTRSTWLLLILLLPTLFAGCEDDLYDTGNCYVSELPNGQALVECENGDALIVGDFVPDGTCQLLEQDDASHILRCDGDDYLIPDTKPSESYSCVVQGKDGQSGVDCEELVPPISSCPKGLSGNLVLGDASEGDNRVATPSLNDAFLRYGCTRFVGSIDIAGNLRPSDREILQQLETASGTLNVSGLGHKQLDLPNLAHGFLDITFDDNPRLKEVRLPILRQARSLTIQNNHQLADIYAPGLESVEETVSISADSPIHTISFPKLVDAGSVVLDGLKGSLSTLSFPSLISAGVTLKNSKLSIDFHFPSLETSSELRIDGNEIKRALSFPKLTHVGILAVTSNKEEFDFRLPALTTLASGSIRYNEELASLVFPELRKISDSTGLTIANNEDLERLNMPNLQDMSGSTLSIHTNESLESIRLDELTTCSSFLIENLEDLETLRIPLLRHVEGRLKITHNESLDQCRVNVIARQLQTIPAAATHADITNNDDDDDCPPAVWPFND